MALVGTACFISGLLLLYLLYHSQGIIHDFAVNLFNGYVYSSASILSMGLSFAAVSYTHLRANETGRNLVCRLLLEKK